MKSSAMINYAVDRKRWSKLNIFEQMANIYSEVGRTFKAKSQDDAEASQEAMIRALDLFDATTEALIEQKSIRSKEILRARDQFLTIYYSQHNQAEEQSLEQYFMHFAVAARLNR